MTCGKPSHSCIDIKRLETLGHAIDTLQHLSVFGGGFVGLGSEDESEVIKYVAGKEGRSGARPRSGQRTAERPWGASGQAHRFRSDALEGFFGAQFRVLAHHYEALGFEDLNGLWVVVKSNPLGSLGPQIHFLIAFPLDPLMRVRGWAFESIGAKAKLMPLKHTNFPDASICAFLPTENAWSPNDGIIALVDHYTVWAIKKLHLKMIGFWPGQQAGVCAYYRRMEFKPIEWCGCLSGKKYNKCHQGIDMLISEEAAKTEFLNIFRCEYDSRKVPISILSAAKSRWNNMPIMNSVI